MDQAWFGAFPTWWPAFIPQSPAFFLPGLAIAFRVTCYYYRGAYYKAFALTPPSCAVRGVPHRYRGETALLLFQNLHGEVIQTFVSKIIVPRRETNR